MAKILCDFQEDWGFLAGHSRFRICDRPAKYAVRMLDLDPVAYRCAEHAHGYEQRQVLSQELREE